MVDFIKDIDDKTNLAGTNRLELLMFTLGRKESGQPALYGINVFKVRELITLPRLIKGPNRHRCCSGVANVRGKAVPVIDLHAYYGIQSEEENKIMVITEFNTSTQGFIVDDVEGIIQLDWKNISEPPKIVSELSGVENGNTLTGMSILADETILLIIDVEQIIAEVLGGGIDVIAATDMTTRNNERTVLFADDSRVARAQVSAILTKMDINFHVANNGQEAYDKLIELGDAADAAGECLSNTLNAIITDVEMPVLDGYMLTRKIREDKRFDSIPIMMHSSLSAEENIRLGKKVGVDAYIPKLKPKEFSEELDRLLNKEEMKKAA